MSLCEPRWPLWIVLVLAALIRFPPCSSLVLVFFGAVCVPPLFQTTPASLSFRLDAVSYQVHVLVSSGCVAILYPHHAAPEPMGR